MFHRGIVRLPIWGMILLGALLTMQSCTGTGRADGGVTGLPYAQEMSFKTLDAYLEYLESRATIDVPYYKEVEPGVYERQVRVRIPGKTPLRKSRAELEEEFGFAK